MSPKEGGRQPGSDGEPLYSAELPEDIEAFLQTREVACLMQETNHGTAFVVKLPAREIQSVKGRVPIRVRHELIQHPSAPVIRTVLRIYDQPQHPLALEMFTNIEDEVQRDDFARLGEQDQPDSARIRAESGALDPHRVEADPLFLICDCT